MKSITSKLSIIILSLAAMAFTFVLGSTSSKALSIDFIGLIGQMHYQSPTFSLLLMMCGRRMKISSKMSFYRSTVLQGALVKPNNNNNK